MSTGAVSAFASTARGAVGEVHSVATETLTHTRLPTEGAAAGTAADREGEVGCDVDWGVDRDDAGEAHATVAATAAHASPATRAPRIMCLAYTDDVGASRGVRP